MATHASRPTFGRRLGAALIGIVATAAPAYAQLDPLLFMKAQTPQVLLVVDTANRMQRDAPTDPANPTSTSNYYDPYVYTRTSAAWETTLGVGGSNTNNFYRRKYAGLVYTSNGSGDKFSANTIQVTTDQNSAFALFDAPSRLALARAALSQVVNENSTVANFGLIKMRQSSPTAASQGNSGPVADADPTQVTPTDAGSLSGRWKISRPTVSGANGSANSNSAVLIKADSATANADTLTILGKSPRDANTGSLVALQPAGGDDANTSDHPVNNLLLDAKTEALRLMKNDTNCRNTVVVLVVGGGEGNTAGATNASLGTTASGFLNVYNGHRVPVYVIAIAPPSADVASLQAIATNSGGQYFEVTKAMIDNALASSMVKNAGTAPTGTIAVPEMVKAINVAVQHAFALQSDFDVAPTLTTPYGNPTEYPVTSPIIGTVNLSGAKDINGVVLSPDPTTVKDRSGNVIPQRSNLMVTTGLSVPGFDLKLRGFRMYKPVADSTQPSGWKFVSDGTRLWVASSPAAASRNLFTALPNGSMVAFTAANASVLAPYMNLNATDAAYVINTMRSLPLGSVVDSTPAVMNAPSLDPPPDDTYPAFASANKDRRTIIFFGTNRGILEAVDARLGVEVWGFVPFNLLPKLRTLVDGQPVGNFDYFVDGSPKVADVKLADGSWHTYLVMGEGAGGMFYQAFDVTMSGMASSVPPTDDTVSDLLNYFSGALTIPYVWSFPTYSDFDPTLTQFQWYGTSKPFGDLRASAPVAEKTVGQTWSDPAIGQVQTTASPYTVLVGSGFAPYSLQQQANRGGTVAGTTFYMLNVNTGALIASKDVGSNGLNENVDLCWSAAVNNCSSIKNALQSDPVATGPSDSRFITKAYIGDLDGRVWRFDIGLSGTTPTFTANPVKLYDDASKQPIFASMATVNVGGTQQYVFTGTGSDLLPSNGVSQQYKLVGVLDNGASGTTTFTLNLAKVDGSAPDEKVTAFPAVAGDIVFFTTTSFMPPTACTLPNANLYALTFIGGPAYDTNGDGSFSSKDSTLVKTVTGARATAPFIVDQHLVFAAGGKVELFGDSQDFNNGVGQAGVRILSWREAR